MIKILLSLFTTAALLISCGNQGKKADTAKSGTSSAAEKVTFASLTENPGNYVGKTISVEGKVVHVCTMSGKKLFITGENPDIRLYVEAGEAMPRFPVELLGNQIEVEGTITRISAAGMNEGNSMSPSATDEVTPDTKAMGADTCETGKALAAQPVLSDLMMVYSRHTVLK